VRFADIWRTNKARALLFLPAFPFRKRLYGRAFDRVLANAVSIPCQVRTLSGTIREQRVERINLLKIVVEGGEMEVLAGIEECHWPLVRQIAMEVAPANKRHVSALLDQLHLLGFGHVTVESMFGGTSNLDDAISCTVYAVRGRGGGTASQRR